MNPGISRRRSTLIAGIGVVAVLGLTACTGPGAQAPSSGSQAAEPIEVVSQPESIGEPIDLGLPVHSSGAFEFDQWPSACALTDEQTLAAVFPQADEVAHAPRPRELDVLSFGMGGSDDPGPFTVAEAECATGVGFPVDGLRLADGNVVVSFTTMIEAAGTPEFTEANAPSGGGEDVEVAGASCVVSERRYDCATEQLVFSITIDARPYGQYVRGDSVYVVDGEEQDHSDGVEAFLAMTEERMLLPVVTAAVERLTA